MSDLTGPSANGDRNASRVVRSWLREDRHEDADRVLWAALDQLDTTPQRQTTRWWARRTPDMNKFVAIGLGAAAVVVVLLIGSNLLGSGSPPPGGAPSESVVPSEAEPSPSGAGGLPVGSSWDLFPEGNPHINVTIPAPGWIGDGGILTKGEGADFAGIISFASPLYVYGDPCQWESTTPDSPSTTVEELVAALSAQASRDASDPVDITLDGYAGKSMALHVPEDVAFADGDGDFTDCDQGYFGSWGAEGNSEPERYHQGPGQIDELWILDVDGDLVVIDAAHYPGTPAEVVDEKRAIVESATFE
jgi:hypothetical protein